MGGAIHDWERGLDPWHKDAFTGVPVDSSFANQGERKEGWFALDGWGNVIGFLPDGAELGMKRKSSEVADDGAN